MQLTNYTVSITLLLAWTIGTMVVRYNAKPENNWPMTYWIAMCLVSLKFPDNTWDYRFIAFGFCVALLIRFEFMNRGFSRFFVALEALAFAYVLLHGLELLQVV